MTISATDAVFPNNAVDLIATRLQTLDEDPTSPLYVAKRPLRRSDPVQSVGVYASYWLPNENSYEMLGGTPPRHQPTLNSYTIAVEAFIKDMDEERGLATHSLLSAMVRSMLYADAPLLLGLRSLQVTIGACTERVQRCGVRTQRYAANELKGSFLYLSTLEYWLETETI